MRFLSKMLLLLCVIGGTTKPMDKYGVPLTRAGILATFDPELKEVLNENQELRSICQKLVEEQIIPLTTVAITAEQEISLLKNELRKARLKDEHYKAQAPNYNNRQREETIRQNLFLERRKTQELQRIIQGQAARISQVTTQATNHIQQLNQERTQYLAQHSEMQRTIAEQNNFRRNILPWGMMVGACVGFAAGVYCCITIHNNSPLQRSKTR